MGRWREEEYSRKTGLSKQLHRAPGHLVRRNNCRVAGGESTLHQQGKDDLIANVLDLVDKRWYNPATQYAGHSGRNHDHSNLNRIVRESVQGDLRCKRYDGLPDHAGDKQDDQVHSELAEHGEQLEREDRVLWLGEIVPEGSHEDDGTD